MSQKHDEIYRIRRRIAKCKRRIDSGKNVKEETSRMVRLTNILFKEDNGNNQEGRTTS